MEDVSATQLLLLSALLFLLPCSAYDACDELDHDDLLSLPFKAPLNWSASTDCCLWDGIICDPLYHIRVIRLWLPKRGLSGVVSSAVTNLTRLTHLNLSHNSLLGSLPDDLLSSLPSLQVIDLSFNRLIGRFPPSSNASNHLQIINLSSNFFNGAIPSSVLVPSISIYKVSNNSFSSFSGHIGDGIVKLTNLNILELHSNQFSRKIPSHIGNLSMLEKLLLHTNNFTGPLPSSLPNCKILSSLNLRVNNLTGELSAFKFSTLQRLATLDLGNNNFIGELPQSLYSCKSLTAIRYGSNQLTGEMSPGVVEFSVFTHCPSFPSLPTT
ncbi:hypothetical protein C1H46_030200 [Malus baccata]|uniref:Leucine-rich repeat-containing N-terminal plant-type domain-containing protein n=1 Tax=Malus baccata TaxID=106549 RepID=A0A540LD40_MALBA|nr:hypothetical protein C1H46_030200 [Malus baccata]